MPSHSAALPWTSFVPETLPLAWAVGRATWRRSADHCYLDSRGGDFIRTSGSCLGSTPAASSALAQVGCRPLACLAPVRQAVIVNPWCLSAGGSDPTAEDIILGDLANEAVIIGGTLVGTSRELAIIDNAVKTAYLGTLGRLRLPRLESWEFQSGGSVGEVVYNGTTNKVQAFLSPGGWTDLIGGVR